MSDETEDGDQTDAQNGGTIPVALDSPKLDLADRYQNMISTQFTSLSNSEDKAWRAIRVTVALLAIYLTGVSLLVKVGNESLNIQVIDIVTIGLGAISLFASLYYSVSVLSQMTVSYGPTTEVGEDLNQDDLGMNYDSVILANYVNALQQNWLTVSNKTGRLNNALSLLLFGIVQLSVGFLFVIASNSWLTSCRKAVSLLISIVISAVIMCRLRQIGTDETEPEGEQTSTDGDPS